MLKRAYNSLSLSGEQRPQLCIERGGLTILAVDVIFSRPQHENSLKLQPVLRTSCKEAHRYCIKSNQIKSLLLSHHHSISALVSEILESVLQTVQKKTTTIYIWTEHTWTVQKTMCKKSTYIYSVHSVL